MAYYKDYTESVRSQIVGLINDRLAWDKGESYKLTADEDGVTVSSTCGILTSAMLESVVPVAKAFGIPYCINKDIDGNIAIDIF